MTIRSLQNKVIAQIEQTASGYGFEIVEQPNWANTGTLFVQPAGAFSTVVSITYEFQSGALSLTLTHRGTPLVPRKQAGRKDGYVKWYADWSHNGSDRDALLQEFMEALSRALASDEAATGRAITG